MVQAILRRLEVERATGLSRSTIYELMAVGGFPKPVPLTPRSVGWIEAEIVRWQRERIEARDKPRPRRPKGSPEREPASPRGAARRGLRSETQRAMRDSVSEIT